MITMENLCYMCPAWNDWLGRCDAGFWCPDKENVNVRYDERQLETIQKPLA